MPLSFGSKKQSRSSKPEKESNKDAFSKSLNSSSSLASKLGKNSENIKTKTNEVSKVKSKSSTRSDSSTAEFTSIKTSTGNQNKSQPQSQPQPQAKIKTPSQSQSQTKIETSSQSQSQTKIQSQTQTQTQNQNQDQSQAISEANTRVIEISSDGSPILLGTGKFLSLPAPYDPYYVRFVFTSTSAIARNGTLHTNLPPQNKAFDRNTFYSTPLNCKFNKSFHVDLLVHSPGPYIFYFTYSPLNDFLSPISNETVKSPFHYFTVQPRFSFANARLPIDSLTMQTVVSKWMGPYETWDSKLALIKNKGYNMVHFTPLQMRGDSNSPYSIYDQLKFDTTIFKNSEKDVKQLVESMEQKHDLLSLTDIVLNHTANNSIWLTEHPEAGYNIENSPHLRPAFELDDSLLNFSDSLSKLGYPTSITTEDALNRIIEGIKTNVLEKIKLWEYYVLDVKSLLDDISKKWEHAKHELTKPSYPDNVPADFSAKCNYIFELVKVNFDTFGERFSRSIDVDKLLPFLLTFGVNLNSFLSDVLGIAKELLNEFNLVLYKEYDNDTLEVIKQLRDRINYTHVSKDGLNYGEVTKKRPLIDTYFTRIKTVSGKDVALANNGWIWGANPLVDFAGPSSRAYLRREVIVWGDCVKLRYATGPQDNPWLWKHMTEYVQLTAKYFKGLRIDNCHSTPLHVGEYLLDRAREVRPDLFIVAELFSGSEDLDKMYVERLGITSLIREAMQCWSPKELSTLIHKHSGRPIGSLASATVASESNLVNASDISALLMDCTHDNLTPFQKRTIEDTLPTAGLVAMCSCATGSVLGFDEGYPFLLDVVGEKRQYTMNPEEGIAHAKKILNDIHKELGKKDASETFIDHKGQYISIHRTKDATGEGYLLVARTKFAPEGDQSLEPIRLNGTNAECILSCALQKTGEYKDSDTVLNPVPSKLVTLEKPTIHHDENTNDTIVSLPRDFPQGSICLIRTKIPTIVEGLNEKFQSGAKEAVGNLNSEELNSLLFACESEERDNTNGQDGTYEIPNYGKLTYAGLQGWVSCIRPIVRKNELAHPLCEHLRHGQWPLDFIENRLLKLITRSKENGKESSPYTPIYNWFKERFDLARKLPSFLLPREFILIVLSAYNAARNHALEQCSTMIKEGTTFGQSLALTSFQMYGKIQSASLFPTPRTGSLAAGLPHFAVNYMRCWGRDVMISLRGLLICTGRYEEAANHILAFASVLKHGMIPNLLDSGVKPRYNSRDSVWFFLQCIQDYVKIAPNGADILSRKVKRRFPLDDTWVSVDDKRAYSYESSIGDIVYEILSRHAAGIKFREHDAGTNIDSQMKDEGFNIEIKVDWNTGFVHGGNQWNCGTWMDKMGESEKAGNKGFPGTPRDGAAIEITGLLASTLKWVQEINKQGLWKYDSVKTDKGESIKFTEWEQKVKENFERCYYIPENKNEDGKYDLDSSIVNRRGIYKDLYKSGKPYEDVQLRPNFAIAMTVAPQLFVQEHAIKCLALADKVLRSPLGMKTLDPSDLNYRPDYLNWLDNEDFACARGRNYHQGPEWLWLTGFFLRAFLKFDLMRKSTSEEKIDTLQQIYLRLKSHRREITYSLWAGLPELTNKNGSPCSDSCPTQAWSSSTLIDLIHDANSINF